MSNEAKTASAVYNEWMNSLIRGFTTVDLSVCPNGSVFYLGLCNDGIKPILVSRTLGGELFYTWYEFYSELVKIAPKGSVPVFLHFYAVSPLEGSGWTADEFDMVKIAKTDFIKPVSGQRAYATLPVPTLESVIKLCKETDRKKAAG